MRTSCRALAVINGCRPCCRPAMMLDAGEGALKGLSAMTAAIAADDGAVAGLSPPRSSLGSVSAAIDPRPVRASPAA